MDQDDKEPWYMINRAKLCIDLQLSGALPPLFGIADKNNPPELHIEPPIFAVEADGLVMEVKRKQRQ